MRVSLISSINFKRKLKPSEENEYKSILRQGKENLRCNGGKNILILPTSACPQAEFNNTGVGSITSSDGINFVDFAKKYWDINEIQLLPTGQYHCHNGRYPMYSGSSMDFGSQMIDIKSYVSDADFKEIVKNNNIKTRVNFHNVVDYNSKQEQILWKLYDNMNLQMKSEFESFKLNNFERLESKALYRACREINGSYDYRKWKEVDKYLFDDSVVKKTDRTRRIKEIYLEKSKTIDFYKFKQFLAEKSLAKAKNELNQKGVKLNGDMICGFSFDEVWANPKAFYKNCSIGWSLPALNLEKAEGEELLRKKVKFYAEHFDGFRVDASWTYIAPNIEDKKNGNVLKKYYADKFLNIIDEEVIKVKGMGYDLKNIMHEVIVGPEFFNVFEGNDLKPYLKNRNKIYTSDYLSKNWGSNNNYLERGWDKTTFIIGARNHDSEIFNNTKVQREALSEILKIPENKLINNKEFVKAKLAEPVGAYNSMIFYMDALGINESFLRNKNRDLDYTSKLPCEYEEFYLKNLQENKAFNPMDALEKNFKAQGLDKTEPKLYKKIVKYRKILEQKEGQATPWLKIGVGIACTSLVLYGIYKCYKHYSSHSSSSSF